MTIAPVGAAPTTSLHTTGATPTAPKQVFDQEVFLSLLVAQLRNQDPTSPMDTTEMIGQSTQLASMEQLTALGTVTRESFALQMRVAAGALVGTQVSFRDGEGVLRTGEVTKVSFDSQVPTVTVGEWTVPLDVVSSIATGTTPPTMPTSPPTDTDTAPDPTPDTAPATSTNPAA